MTRERFIQEILPGVTRNALISDARYWGYYSMCGVLLRLREQYRFETGLPPGGRLDEASVADWIGQREVLWNEAGAADFVPMVLDGQPYEPFNVEPLNQRLEEASLVYGAGYGIHMKPVFFLADLVEKRTHRDLSIYICGREYARDMSLNPAMVQGRLVYARREVMSSLLWGKFEEHRFGRKSGLLGEAFGAYGVSHVLEREALDRIAAEEIEAVIYHEYGEAEESRRLGADWLEMLAGVGHPRDGLLLRSLKDVLADTCEGGMLQYIVKGKRRGPLAFFMVFLEGYRRLLCSNIRDAVADFGHGFSWEELDRARRETWARADRFVSDLLGVWKEGDPDRFHAEIERVRTLTENPRSSL